VNDYSLSLQIYSEPYEVAAMATETRDQSASLAEVSRSFFTDPAGLPQSKNEDISSSQIYPNACGNQAYLWTIW
jgi:hypothetical protein